MDPRLEQIFSLLPHRCNSIFIAGGAAVNFDLAGDVDLIFGGKNGFKEGSKFIETFAHWREFDGEGYESAIDLHLIGDAWDPMSGKIIQVLWAKAKTALETIDKFDISTHAAGWTSKGEPFHSDDYNLSTVKVREPFSNHKTFSRYIKICNRYQIPVDLSILEKLSSKVEVKEEIPLVGPKVAGLPTLTLKTFSWDSETSLAKQWKDLANATLVWEWKTKESK